ncbi:DUF4244 domain-containing protein [Rothia sp. AR01]|uniref:DUF4244 domain-containing protein n=1 Tax=Rothia santali TaxID=2949643 RepID=A0A9X2HCT3_9MICC|nr:DUF4244 domain-containing protein [Rothia santali]MCP3426981.1 DUF4244 domain-containing protein [Rothia santali]
MRRSQHHGKKNPVGGATSAERLRGRAHSCRPGRTERWAPQDDDPELGATTAEYGIVMLAAVGFAGLLVVILRSEEVREMLLGVIRTALSSG